MVHVCLKALIVCMTLLNSTTANTGDWTSTPGQVCACNGNDVTLSWSYGLSTDVTAITLFYEISPRELILIKLGTQNATVREHYKERVDLSWNNGDVTMKLRNVAEADQGNYSIVLTTEAGTLITDMCSLRVIPESVVSISMKKDNSQENSGSYDIVVIYNHTNMELPNVTLNISPKGPSTTLKQCASPCRFKMWQEPKDDYPHAVVQYCTQCSYTATRLFVSTNEKSSTENDNNHRIVVVFVALLLLIVGILICGYIIWGKKNQLGWYNPIMELRKKDRKKHSSQEVTTESNSSKPLMPNDSTIIDMSSPSTSKDGADDISNSTPPKTHEKTILLAHEANRTCVAEADRNSPKESPKITQSTEYCEHISNAEQIENDKRLHDRSEVNMLVQNDNKPNNTHPSSYSENSQNQTALHKTPNVDITKHIKEDLENKNGALPKHEQDDIRRNIHGENPSTEQSSNMQAIPETKERMSEYAVSTIPPLKPPRAMTSESSRSIPLTKSDGAENRTKQHVVDMHKTSNRYTVYNPTIEHSSNMEIISDTKEIVDQRPPDKNSNAHTYVQESRASIENNTDMSTTVENISEIAKSAILPPINPRATTSDTSISSPFTKTNGHEVLNKSETSTYSSIGSHSAKIEAHEKQDETVQYVMPQHICGDTLTGSELSNIQTEVDPSMTHRSNKQTESKKNENVKSTEPSTKSSSNIVTDNNSSIRMSEVAECQNNIHVPLSDEKAADQNKISPNEAICGETISNNQTKSEPSTDDEPRLLINVPSNSTIGSHISEDVAEVPNKYAKENKPFVLKIINNIDTDKILISNTEEQIRKDKSLHDDYEVNVLSQIDHLPTTVHPSLNSEENTDQDALQETQSIDKATDLKEESVNKNGALENENGVARNLNVAKKRSTENISSESESSQYKLQPNKLALESTSVNAGDTTPLTNEEGSGTDSCPLNDVEDVTQVTYVDDKTIDGKPKPVMSFQKVGGLETYTQAECAENHTEDKQHSLTRKDPNDTDHDHKATVASKYEDSPSNTTWSTGFPKTDSDVLGNKGIDTMVSTEEQRCRKVKEKLHTGHASAWEKYSMTDMLVTQTASGIATPTRPHITHTPYCPDKILGQQLSFSPTDTSDTTHVDTENEPENNNIVNDNAISKVVEMNEQQHIHDSETTQGTNASTVTQITGINKAITDSTGNNSEASDMKIEHIENVEEMEIENDNILNTFQNQEEGTTCQAGDDVDMVEQVPQFFEEIDDIMDYAQERPNILPPNIDAMCMQQTVLDPGYVCGSGDQTQMGMLPEHYEDEIEHYKQDMNTAESRHYSQQPPAPTDDYMSDSSAAMQHDNNVPDNLAGTIDSKCMQQTVSDPIYVYGSGDQTLDSQMRTSPEPDENIEIGPAIMERGSFDRQHVHTSRRGRFLLTPTDDETIEVCIDTSKHNTEEGQCTDSMTRSESDESL